MLQTTVNLLMFTQRTGVSISLVTVWHRTRVRFLPKDTTNRFDDVIGCNFLIDRYSQQHSSTKVQNAIALSLVLSIIPTPFSGKMTHVTNRCILSPSFCMSVSAPHKCVRKARAHCQNHSARYTAKTTRENKL